MLFKRKRPKLPYFEKFPLISKKEDENGTVRDCTDRLPHTLVVRDFDIFCFFFSAGSYLADICSDALVAYIHYREQRIWAFVFITVLTILPSVMLNIVSFLWWIDDVSVNAVQLNSRHKYSKQLLFRIVVCLLQAVLLKIGRPGKPVLNVRSCINTTVAFPVNVGVILLILVSPVIWYLEAALAAVRFRMTEEKSKKLYLYAAMVEAERDASLLRFFEAFLESAPQMLVQGVALVHVLFSENATKTSPKWILLQVISISFSLLSACWSFVIQHRSLRISRPDKKNITPSGALMQLLWRVFTVSSRYICFVLFIIAYRYWIMLLFAVHFSVSLMHILALQPLELGTNCKLVEMGLVTICAAVHLFAPCNMAEGRSRYRYIVAYCIEAIETVVLLYMILSYEHCILPYKGYTATGTCLLFLLGISCMLIYYRFFHPNIVHSGTRNVLSSSVEASYHISSSPLNQTSSDM